MINFIRSLALVALISVYLGFISSTLVVNMIDLIDQYKYASLSFYTLGLVVKVGVGILLITTSLTLIIRGYIKNRNKVMRDEKVNEDTSN